jgi:hypothetical protein
MNYNEIRTLVEELDTKYRTLSEYLKRERTLGLDGRDRFYENGTETDTVEIKEYYREYTEKLDGKLNRISGRIEIIDEILSDLRLLNDAIPEPKSESLPL